MNLEMIKTKTIKMILQFSIPSIIAMVLTSLITIADGFFIGNYVGKEGLAAVNLGLPLLYVYLGIGIMFGVGGVSIAGMAFGAGEIRKSNEVFNQTIVTAAIATVFISLLAMILSGPVLRMIAADEKVIECFKSYYSIMIFTYPVMIMNSVFGMFIRGEGKPHIFMVLSTAAVICNIVLDYIFIKSMNFGIQGAAFASLISVLLEAVFMILFFLKWSDIYKFCTFKRSKAVLRNTVFNGSSEFIGQMSMSISMFAYNWVILKTVGVSGIAAFTIVGYMAYLFGMIIVGFGQGSSALTSFSYGAGEYELSIRIRKLTNRFVFLSGIVFVVLLLVGSKWYSMIFVQNESVQKMVQSGIPVFVIAFLVSGINTITSFYFTSIGKAKESAVISSSRGLVVLLLCIMILPRLFGMTGVWLAAPVTEVITVFISFYYIDKQKA